MNLLFGLVASSIVGSVIFIALLLFRLITARVFNKTWHYYCLLVPLVFFLGGAYIAISLSDIISHSTIENASSIRTSQEITIGIPHELIRPYAFDNPMFTMPVRNGEMDAGSVILPYKASQLMMYLEIAMPFLLGMWVLGAILFIVTSTKKYLQYRRMVLNEAQYVADVDCEIPIMVSVAANTPMLLGVIRPIIILPNMYFSDGELDMILAHETVHYKRKDLFVKLFMLIANAVHWFNPAVYALNKQLNAACELSCDEIVVQSMNTQNRRYYGETILHVLKHSTAQKSLVGNIAFATDLCNSKKNFKRRLISMMSTKKMRKSVAVLSLAIGMLVAYVLERI